MMNHKGQYWVYAATGIMMAIFMLFIVIALIGPMKTIVDDARGPTNLNCASHPQYNSSATSHQITCVGVDLVIPAFFGVLIIGALAWIGWTAVKSRREE